MRSLSTNPLELTAGNGPKPQGERAACSFLTRFVLMFSVCLGLNVFPLALTWRAFGTDGFEQIGWPVVFFERGGFSYVERFHLHWLAVDVVIAIGVAYLVAKMTRYGLVA